MPDDRKRDYNLTDIPTLKSTPTADDKELLKTLYGEINANYRNLADIRFKLLAFTPAVSVLVWVELMDKIKPENLMQAIAGLLISTFALRIILGIRVYDSRNDELYNDLISRGRKIEDELSICTAIFRGRLQPNKRDKLFSNEINHGRGLSLIYGSVIIGWIVIACWYLYSITVLI